MTLLVDRHVLAAVLLAALAGWALAPLPEEPAPPVLARRDDWRPVELPRRPNLMAAAVEVGTAPMWGARPAPSAAASAAVIVDPRWRLAGIYGRGSERRVIVSFMAESKHDQTLRVGESLPSGHRIVSIDDNEICIRIGNRVRRLALDRLGS